MWDFILSFLFIRAVFRSRPLRLVLTVGLLAALVAGFIYAVVVFKALSERTTPNHVHTHRSH